MEENKSHVGMATCFVCNEVKHLLLDRRLKNSLLKKACYDKEPCDKCKGYMKQGIILISVRNGTDKENPYRTGGWVVIKEEAVKKMFNDTAVLKSRMAFIEDEVWDKLGLPRGEVNGI